LFVEEFGKFIDPRRERNLLFLPKKKAFTNESVDLLFCQKEKNGAVQFLA